MLRNQAALCGSTGNLEMSVFQMLVAGNIRQPASSPADLAGGEANVAVRAGAAKTVAPQAVRTAESASSMGPERARIRTRQMLA